MSDDLTLIVGGRQLTGWTSVAVTRGAERMPNSFSIAATEQSTVYSDAVRVSEGAACSIRLGPDRVFTGYVDVVTESFGSEESGVILQGRGKCQDLVDCSAEWKSCQISGASAREIAEKLAAPYGITVSAPDGDGPTVPQFNINVTDTPADILEQITRHAGLLYYEDADGNLVLAEASDAAHASGFVEGVNIQAARYLRSKAQRYAEYSCSYVSVTTSGLYGENDGAIFFVSKDPAVARHRKLVLVADNVYGGPELVKKRAEWEAARRAGQGQQLQVTVDSWRDGRGKLWTPNTRAPAHLPRFKISGDQRVISEVTYRYAAGSGRTADVTLMPVTAFLPQPLILQPLIPGLAP